jgi:hypothetical protein
MVHGEVRELVLTLPQADTRTLHTIERRAHVLDREYEDGVVKVRALIGNRVLEHVRAACPGLVVTTAG